MRRYGSFLVRWWELGPERRHLNIRHVQSNEEMTVTALDDAVAWMAARVAEVARVLPDEAAEEVGRDGDAPDAPIGGGRG